MRARNIKPGFFKNDQLAEVDPFGRLLFMGLPLLADRRGRLEDRPKRIKGELFPYDDVDVDDALNQLAAKKEPDGSPSFIIRYSVNGLRYVQIVNFEKHQNPHIREPESTIPAPGEHSTSTVQEQEEHGSGPADSPSLNPDSPILIPERDYVDQAQRIFDCWRKVMGKDKAQFLPQRKRKIIARLKEGYTEEQCIQAITNVSQSPFHMGDNDRGREYNSIDLIFRNGEKLEEYVNLRCTERPILPRHTRTNMEALRRFQKREAKTHEQPRKNCETSNHHSPALPS